MRLVSCVLAVAAAGACQSAAEPVSSSSEAIMSFPRPGRPLPWAYGQSGNQPAQTASSTSDMQLFCVPPPSASNVVDYLWDSASPYDGIWMSHPAMTALPYGLHDALGLLGGHVSAIPGATAQSIFTSAGPQSLTAFWVDEAHDVVTADQNGGQWAQPHVITGPFATSPPSSVGPSGKSNGLFPVAGAQVNGTTQLAVWVAEDDSVWESVRGASWGAPVQIAPAWSAAGPIDVMAKSSTHVDVVYTTVLGGLADAWWDASVNSTYTFTVSPIPGSTGVSYRGGISEIVGGPAEGDLSVFWISQSGALMQTVNDAATNSWLSPTVVASMIAETVAAAAIDSGIGATTTASLGASATSGGRIQIAWVASDGTVVTACNDVGASCYGSWNGAWGYQTLTSPGAASHDPIGIASRAPSFADILYVTPQGDLHDTWWASSASTTWTDVEVSAGACKPCGAVGGDSCNGQCPSGSVLDATNYVCEPCGAVYESACFGPDGPVCTQPFTVESTQAGNAGTCICDPTAYPASIDWAGFNLEVAPQLAGFAVNIVNDALTVTVPPPLTPPAKTTVSVSGAWVTSLDMPTSGDPNGWVWSMASGSNIINISTTLTAEIGVSGFACGATARVNNVAVSIDLVPSGRGGGVVLEVQDVSIAITEQNTPIYGCSVIAGSIRSSIQSGLQSQLQQQFNSFLGQNTQAITNIFQSLANTPAPFDPGYTALTMLPAPAPTSTTYSWSCSTTSLANGEIDGSCFRVCATAPR